MKDLIRRKFHNFVEAHICSENQNHNDESRERVQRIKGMFASSRRERNDDLISQLFHDAPKMDTRKSSKISYLHDQEDFKPDFDDSLDFAFTVWERASIVALCVLGAAAYFIR